MNDVKIRYMLRADIEELVQISNELYPNPWIAKDFVRCLKTRNCASFVVDKFLDGQEEFPIGWLIYCNYRTHIDLVDLAVAKEYHRKKIGTLMIEKIMAKLSLSKKEICASVEDWNLNAHLFLKKQGFKATIERGEIDSYLFTYRYIPSPEECEHHPNNRIKRFFGASVDQGGECIDG